jgi:hypothetical protein
MIKAKAFRNDKYLRWVKHQPCIICGCPSDDAHHITGTGNLSGMGMKAPDIYTMPVCRPHHTEIHQSPELWPEQWEWIARTMAKAISEGVLKVA